VLAKLNNKPIRQGSCLFNLVFIFMQLSKQRNSHYRRLLVNQWVVFLCLFPGINNGRTMSAETFYDQIACC
jgi:hypothetical protein